MKLFKYLTYSALATIMLTSCEDNKVAHRDGVENEDLTIQHRPGMNVVGRVTVDGVPRQGVVVSDGINVIATDENGEYQMRSSGRQHIFVSVPADCAIPEESGLPKIYKTLRFDEDAVIQMNFKLKSRPVSQGFKLFTIADPQIGDNVDIAIWNDDIMGNMVDFAASLTGNVYGISLGDLVWNKPDLFPTYKRMVAQPGIPMFSVIGNHDHNETVKNDTESDREFRDALGPTYYSCNIGQWHLVVLDDVLYRGVSDRNDYSATITDQQLEWLAKDLEHVGKDKSILIATHIPTMRRNNPGNHVTNNQALYNLVKDYPQVQILSGHSHNNYITTIADNINETTIGAVMGAYWNGVICNDGSPRGYAVLEFDGNKVVDKYYIGSETPRDYQIKIYLPEDATYRAGRDKDSGLPLINDNESLLVNVFFWHTDWTVELQEDGGSWTELKNTKTLDPEAVKTLQWDNPWEKRPSAEPETNNDHMFLYKPAKTDWQTITVRASDPYGNVYTASVNNNQ